jgi:hypothetical protein
MDWMASLRLGSNDARNRTACLLHLFPASGENRGGGNRLSIGEQQQTQEMVLSRSGVSPEPSRKEMSPSAHWEETLSAAC